MHVHVRTSFFHCSYSLYEPKDIVLSEYKSGLEKAILKNSTLLVQLNDAFCKTHPWLAQKVCTRSAHAAVSKVCADAVLKKVLNVRRKKAGEFLKDVRAINAIKLEDSHLLEGVRYHTAGSEPFFYDASYNHTRQLGAIPVDLNGRCVMAEEIGDRHLIRMRPLKWMSVGCLLVVKWKQFWGQSCYFKKTWRISELALTTCYSTANQSP